MSQSVRSKSITGNWKMHKTLEEATSFVRQLIPLIQGDATQVSLAVPYTMIHLLSQEAKETALVIGAQNMNDASEGAFTGEVAGRMLKDAGATFVLLGHSERRHLFNEDNGFINRKIKRAIKDGLRPILCIGETEAQHKAGQAQEVIRAQLVECLAGVESSLLEDLGVAYEPVWAVGAGISATPEIAQEMHAFCREILEEILTPDVAATISIQYGGSVNPSNALDLLSKPDIDGLLIGGASLSLESFSQIINISESLLNGKVESV